jgi:hypothetical protein
VIGKIKLWVFWLGDSTNTNLTKTILQLTKKLLTKTNLQREEAAQQIHWEEAAHEDKFAAGKTKSGGDNSSRTGTQSGNWNREDHREPSGACSCSRIEAKQNKQEIMPGYLPRAPRGKIRTPTWNLSSERSASWVENGSADLSWENQWQPVHAGGALYWENCRQLRGKNQNRQLEAKTASGYGKSRAASWGRTQKSRWQNKAVIQIQDEILPRSIKTQFDLLLGCAHEMAKN